MDLINHMFTNIKYLKPLLEIAAKQWGFVIEDNILLDAGYEMKDGFIFEIDTGLLVTTQKIYCRVKPNKEGITAIHLLHDSQKGILHCQAYKTDKPQLKYVIHAERGHEEDGEFKKYIDTAAGL